MIEQLKELEPSAIVIFDTEDVAAITDTDEMEVSEVRICAADDNEFVIVELDEFYLVAHNFDTDARYFFYQVLDSGAAEDLENDGYYFLTEEQDFRSKIVCRDESRGHVYKHSEVGAVYEMSDQNSETEEIVSLCEYISNTHDMTHMLVIKNEEDELLILQGIEITEDDFTIADVEDDED
jgi:hypothetical protein